MKAHTTGFKNAEKELGRQLRAVITYGNVTLEEEIYSITPHYNADLLKSVMKQLDLELSVDIPLETVLNCRIGILVNGSYEMLNYGNYVVYKSEKQEDTNTYKLTCYDKILYSMKQNEQLNITYPISIKDYLNAIANKLGLTVSTTTFYNESMMIQDELYLGLEYTYRDILDEIAQVTGSIICLNENDEILVKYPTQTNDIIDEEFLKDVNVEFGQKYGEINSIVLSRSGESDNVYLRDEESVAQNGLTEVKIVDNQIMNFNDRSDYLPGILNALNGLYYYINDFSSTGILYYDVGDLYNIQIGQNTYQCLMLNNEIDITTGIEEIIHTDLPEQSETDYTKADKTDRKINQTYLIVDKQNQQIESLITTQTDQNQKIARVTQTVDELNSKISDIVDVTTSLETNSARLEFEGINHSEPIRVVIHPVGVNISKLHPSISLKPSSNLTIKTRILRFFNTTTNETFDYELPDDLLYYDSENYDEFILDYDSLTCIVNKNCKWNNDGTVGLLTNQRTDEYTFPHIELTDGDYTVQLIQYNNGYLFVRLMVQNIYTTQFATKSELNSEISQTVDNINLSINKKLSGYSTTTEMNSAINLKANQITSSVSENYATKTELNSSTSSLNSKIDQTATNISLTIDDVQEQVETAQSTADTATTKANNAQTSANNAQSTADSINTNLTTNYYTKTQTNSAINQKADSITSTVSQTYSTKTETATAKNEAINSANTATDNKLKNYSTTTQMNSAITQKADQITSSVSATYSKKSDSVTSVDVQYALSTSTTTAPTSGWSTTAPTWISGKYMWQRTIINYVDGSSETSDPTCIAGATGQTGAKGDKGDTGATGQTGIGVNQVIEQYYLSTSNTGQSGGSWQATQPTWTSGKYIWIRSKITWTDNTITYTTPILASSLNKANETANSANSTANNVVTNFGTYIEQNTESVKLAWNQISEYIQMMIINNNASFAILDENKNVMMALDKKGQHFYERDGTTVFGEMGVQTVDDNNYIAFSVESDYDTDTANGMAWGIKTKKDNKFHPILFIRNFNIGPENSDASFGELELNSSNLVLNGIGTGIKTGGVFINGDPTGFGLYFWDEKTNKSLLAIHPENVIDYASITILDNIKFYANQAGSNSFRIGNDNNAYCLFTDEGSIHCSNIIISDGSNLVSINPNGEVIGHDLNFYGLPSYQGQKLVYGQDGHRYYLDWTGSRLNFWVDTTNVGTLSDKRLKTEIQDIDEDFIKAIEEVEMKQFKVANRNGLISFGILAQDLIEIFKKYNKNPFDYEIVYKTQFRIDDDTVYYAINYEQFLILKQKAMDKKIEELQTKDKQKDEIISKLIERVEKLERKEIKNELHKDDLGE